MASFMSNKIFVTGASGFIAKHILRDLLDAGYEVRGSLRTMNRADEVREALLKHVKDHESVNNRLEIAELDLNRDDGWEAALQNTTALLHTASPFPLAQPKNEDDVIRPAVEGTQRALSAALASGLKRVILTSSTVAITNRKLADGQNAYNENDWTDVDSAMATPYAKSKTLAERAAWDFVAEHPEMQLTTINPGMVYGPPLDQQFGTSVQTIKRFLQARGPMLPRFGFPIVDVRDVSRMHIRALEVPKSIGRRLLCAEGFAWYSEIGEWRVATGSLSSAPDFAARGAKLDCANVGDI